MSTPWAVLKPPTLAGLGGAGTCVCWVVMIPAQGSLDFHPHCREEVLLCSQSGVGVRGGLREREPGLAPLPAAEGRLLPGSRSGTCFLTAERKDQLGILILCLVKRFCRNVVQSRPFQRKDSYSLIYSFYEANICQYRKNGKEDNCRPQSHINIDAKIFNTILANRI